MIEKIFFKRKYLKNGNRYLLQQVGIYKRQKSNE